MTALAHLGLLVLAPGDAGGLFALNYKHRFRLYDQSKRNSARIKRQSRFDGIVKIGQRLTPAGRTSNRD